MCVPVISMCTADFRFRRAEHSGLAKHWFMTNTCCMLRPEPPILSKSLGQQTNKYLDSSSQSRRSQTEALRSLYLPRTMTAPDTYFLPLVVERYLEDQFPHGNVEGRVSLYTTSPHKRPSSRDVPCCSSCPSGPNTGSQKTSLPE